MDVNTERGATTGTKRALLIGVDGYQSVTNLEGCVNDILAIRSFLIGKGGWRAADVQVLAAPPAGTAMPADVGNTPPPNRENILAAFTRLGQQTKAHDQIVIYYSGHGVRLGQGPGTLTANPDPNTPSYHISAICPVDTQLTGLNLVLNRELNAGIDALVAAGATVTVVFDCCHSGGVSSKDPTILSAVREVVLDPQDIDWAAMREQYGLDAADAAGQRAVEPDGGGWVPTIDKADELIVVSGCRDVEVSHEYTPADQRHGALTYFLLDALQKTDANQVARLRWMDIYPKVRGNVNGQFPDQMPTLEGRAERPVFGGQWTPYAPGFTISVGPGGALALDGGTIHGLGPNAQVAIYPPNTAVFTQADASGVGRVIANIVSATPVSSQAQVIAGDARSVQDGSRALLIRPSTDRPPLPVKLTQVPSAILAGIQGAAGASTFLNLNPGTQPPAVEVAPWQRGPQVGWAILKAKLPSATNPPSENDVIGFLVGGSGAPADSELGAMLGAGLVQWARYCSVLNRRNDDATLSGMVTLQVLASTDRNKVLAWGGADAPVRGVNAAGSVWVGANESLLLRLAVDPHCPASLNLVVLLASDEGNIALLYDTGLNPVPAGEQRPVGLNGPRNTFKLPVSAWQTASNWVFKLIATDADHPFDARSLTLDDTVQDLLTTGVRGLPTADALPAVLWTTVEVPVVVTKP